MTTTTNAATTTTTTDGGYNDDPNGVYDETDLGHPGYGPFRYRLLAEPHLTRELARQASEKRYQLENATSSCVYMFSYYFHLLRMINIQTCESSER